MRVGIIGAGAAGLSSARHVLANGYDCVIFESSQELGGTWFYTDDVGSDRYGYPVYSAMYKGLRTNLPKEVMGFPDFSIPESMDSYPTQEDILEFLNQYADKFKIKPHIKFKHHVQNIRPLPNNKWLVISVEKPSGKIIEQIFDVVMICNGHYNKPAIPKLKGIDKFAGEQFHSHAYRSSDKFAGKSALVIGAGPSGLDLTLQISKVARKVVLSHHLKEPIKTKYPSNVEFQPDVKEIINETLIKFVNGTKRSFDIIFFCTGYKYNFPFLDKSCQITITDNQIAPIYKHMINIERSSMCFIGIPFNVCAFHMFDLQARYYMAFIKSGEKIPSKQEMYEDTETDLKIRASKGYSNCQAHLLGPDQDVYYQSLAVQARTSSIPPVIVKLRDESVKRLYEDLSNFRKDKYKIINSRNFIRIL